MIFTYSWRLYLDLKFSTFAFFAFFIDRSEISTCFRRIWATSGFCPDFGRWNRTLRSYRKSDIISEFRVQNYAFWNFQVARSICKKLPPTCAYLIYWGVLYLKFKLSKCEISNRLKNRPWLIKCWLWADFRVWEFFFGANPARRRNRWSERNKPRSG